MARKASPNRPARDLPGRPGRRLSPDESREAAENLAAFFRLLDAWDRARAAGGAYGVREQKE